MRHYFALVLAVVFWCAVPGLLPVSAQQVSSFEQLQLLVKPGDKIEVLGADGIKTKGKIEHLTPASLRLTTKGGFRDFAQKEALLIKQKQGDSLANGAWIGAAVGAGVGVSDWILEGGCDCTSGEIVAGVAVFSAIGTGIGVGIDALIQHQQTIYRSPAQTALRSLRVAPLLTGGRKGAVVRFSF